ncbi:hypothetical protein TNCV_2467221 [Trichonephila clavipes]|nr:hypothetical protein TNCV_2467221 [Trichonephila clavipes]
MAPPDKVHVHFPSGGGKEATEEGFSGLSDNLGGRTGKILRPSSVALKSKNQEINRLQLAVKLPWAIFFESVDILSQSILFEKDTEFLSPICSVTVHEQMSRFGGLSEERPSVFKTRSKLGTHLSTQCSGDERQSRPCAAR